MWEAQWIRRISVNAKVNESKKTKNKNSSVCIVMFLKNKTNIWRVQAITRRFKHISFVNTLHYNNMTLQITSTYFDHPSSVCSLRLHIGDIPAKVLKLFFWGGERHYTEGHVLGWRICRHLGILNLASTLMRENMDTSCRHPGLVSVVWQSLEHFKTGPIFSLHQIYAITSQTSQAFWHDKHNGIAFGFGWSCRTVTGDIIICILLP